MKLILFQAIPPKREQPQRDWINFLTAAEQFPLPDHAEKLAPNVWILPEGQAYLDLSRLAAKHATATRCLPFAASSGWQPLSP